jgi:hypothetical protein
MGQSAIRRSPIVNPSIGNRPIDNTIANLPSPIINGFT